MNISLKKTIVQIDRCLAEGGGASADQLHKMYDLTLRLQSQLLSVIYDMETFGGSAERVANAHSGGKNKDSVVTLTITEPLPSMKRLTEAVEEHWKAMIHAAIGEAAQQRPLPYFDKAMVEVVLNNLKGIFFEDDNMEHMAFSVIGRWGEKGATIIRILDFDKSQQIRSIT